MNDDPCDLRSVTLGQYAQFLSRVGNLLYPGPGIASRLTPKGVKTHQAIQAVKQEVRFWAMVICVQACQYKAVHIAKDKWRYICPGVLKFLEP